MKSALWFRYKEQRDKRKKHTHTKPEIQWNFMNVYGCVSVNNKKRHQPESIEIINRRLSFEKVYCDFDTHTHKSDTRTLSFDFVSYGMVCV